MNQSITPQVSAAFGRQSLAIDVVQETERLVEELRRSVHETLHRQGAVVGISGGIDSSLVLALCAKAFGPEHVIGVLLPEQESSPESAELAHLLAAQYGVPTVTEDITGALEGAGCYRRRDEAIKRIFPDFGAGWKAKIVLAGNLLEQAALNVFRLTVTDPQGQEFSKRLPMHEFAQIVAASNFKQRMRMSMLYYHAELRNYAVIGTANKNEHALGFFVKYGDGGVDIQLIAHLYKTQVYQLCQVSERARRDSAPHADDGYVSRRQHPGRILLSCAIRYFGYGLAGPRARPAAGRDRTGSGPVGRASAAHHRRHRQQATGDGVSAPPSARCRR